MKVKEMIHTEFSIGLTYKTAKEKKKLKFGTDPKRYISLKLGSGYLESPLCVL